MNSLPLTVFTQFTIHLFHFLPIYIIMCTTYFPRIDFYHARILFYTFVIICHSVDAEGSYFTDDVGATSKDLTDVSEA